VSFVVQQPNSETNRSDRYRVTDYEGWIKYINGASSTYAYVSFDTYAEAKAAADVANGLDGNEPYHAPDCDGSACDGCGWIDAEGTWHAGPCPEVELSYQAARAEDW
jgi:hypothetical protein